MLQEGFWPGRVRTGMQKHLVLASALVGAALVAAACDDSAPSSRFTGDVDASSEASAPDNPGFGLSDAAPDGALPAPQNIETARIEPADATLVVTAGQVATQPFRLLAKLKGKAGEVDLTSRTVFHVPEHFLVGGFPADGSSLFSTRIPSAAYPQPQRGGRVTVQARVANTDGPVTVVTTSLTVPPRRRAPGSPPTRARSSREPSPPSALLGCTTRMTARCSRRT